MTTPSIDGRWLMILLVPAIIACSDNSAGGWTRHTIDNDYLGADGVDLEDIDQDGDLDAVVGWEESGLILAYENPGPDRVMASWPTVDVGGGLDLSKVEDVIFADFDTDGLVDAVISATEVHSFKLGIHWLSDVRDWQSSAAWHGTWIDPQQRHAYLSLATGQLDNVHGNDIVVGTKHKRVDGVAHEGQLLWFAAPAMLGPQHSDLWKGQLIARIGWINHIELVDLDADGDNDVLISDRTNRLRWFENRLSSEESWIEHEIGPNYGDFAICQRVVKGRKSGIVAFWGDGPVVYFQNAKGSWRRRKVAAENPFPDDQLLLGIKGIACGDLDLDGTNDIVVSVTAEGHGVFAYLRGPDSWRLVMVAGTDRNNHFKGIKHDNVSLADLDADGDLDVITTEENGGFLGRGLGVIWFENPTRQPTR